MNTTETLDKLYLELAQFTGAQSPRERELLGCIQSIARAVGCNHTEDADGRNKLVRCVEEELARLATNLRSMAKMLDELDETYGGDCEEYKTGCALCRWRELKGKLFIEWFSKHPDAPTS